MERSHRTHTHDVISARLVPRQRGTGTFRFPWPYEPLRLYQSAPEGTDGNGQLLSRRSIAKAIGHHDTQLPPCIEHMTTDEHRRFHNPPCATRQVSTSMWIAVPKPQVGIVALEDKE